MVLQAPLHRYTFEDYLDLEEVAGVRHEYLGGDIYAMAGGAPEHAAMAAAITAQLGDGACRVYSSDLRLRVLETGLATYPDVTVICGPSKRDPRSATHVVNPKVLVEVLSPSTADYDRGEKLEHYKKIAGLDAIVLFSHDQPQATLFSSEAADWIVQIFGPGETLYLPSIKAKLVLDPIYEAARKA